MKTSLFDKHKPKHQTLHYYLILSYAFEFMACVGGADSVTEHLGSAEKFIDAGKYNDALPHFHEAINADPNNYLTYFKRATAFLALNNPKSALNDLNKAIELNDQFTPALNQRASLLSKLEKSDEGPIDYETLLRQDSNTDDTLFMYDKIEKLKDEFMITDTQKRSRNYASSECAKVVETNPEAKKSSHIINEMTDEYMLNPCKAKIWLVIELCETIQATHIQIANYELFSSTPKDFTVYFSDIYPALDWKLVGQFTAADSRKLQTFDLKKVGFGKFIRVEFHTYYGNEHYCPINEVKIYGNSMVDEYEKENSVDSNLEDHRNRTGKLGSKKLKPKTSAMKVYFSMMAQLNSCGLSQSTDKNNHDSRLANPKKEPSIGVIMPQPTQQPAVANRTTPLKPSIFVELSNKVKASETSLTMKLKDIERKFEKLESQFRFSAHLILTVMIAIVVYKIMSDLL